jgi:hypothetical protein
MDQIATVLEAMGLLDIVLAVFGAVIVTLWCGRGKKLGGLISGALIGGFAKPTFFLLIGSGLLFMGNGDVPEITQTPEQQRKTLEFWSK